MMPADLPLIAWADVPEGPVWFRPKGSGGDHWYAGLRFGGMLVDGAGPINHSEMEFTPAEQQPGEWAAELDRTTRLHSATMTDFIAINTANQRLRDGLAALEQEMRDKHEDVSLQMTTRLACGDVMVRLAALREGQTNG